jgi:tripartite-type tricarboxylate transporter receptor subunit TctC
MKIAARLLTTALLIAPAASAVFAEEAANYPARQIRIVVGFAAGGPADTLARIISEHLTAS